MWSRAPPLLDLLVPVRCAACATGETLLCAACRAALRRLRPPLCERCGAPTAWPVARCAECQGRRRLSDRAGRRSPTRGLHGAWWPPGRSAACRVSMRCSPSSSPRWCREPDVDAITYVPGDRRSDALARHQHGRGARRDARRAVGARARRSLARTRRSAAARTRSRTGAERTSAGPSVQRDACRRRDRSRRRRVHDRCNGAGGGDRAPPSRRPDRRRRHARADRCGASALGPGGECGRLLARPTRRPQ